jgi:hypothetical protein
LIRKIVLFLLIFTVCSGAKAYFKDQFMKPEEVKRKWGTEKFDPAKFKRSSPEERAKMAFDLINSKEYVNRNADNVLKELGPSTGLYFSEMVPAYVIGNINEKPDELWQVVFLLSNDSKSVKAVRVHKKCCY